jgi:hypothetical protein
MLVPILQKQQTADAFAATPCAVRVQGINTLERLITFVLRLLVHAAGVSAFQTAAVQGIRG